MPSRYAASHQSSAVSGPWRSPDHQTVATRRSSTASPTAASTSSTLTPNSVGSSENVRRISGSLPRGAP